jgi:hypothetical protein
MNTGMDKSIRYLNCYCITCLNLLHAGYDGGIGISSYNGIATRNGEQGTE